MKYFFTLITLVVSLQVLAQSPERFSYQAVVRGSLRELITDKEVLVRVSILEQSVTGAAVYVEEHRPTTNENGLLTLQIGGGTVVSGIFDDIDWSKGNFFLETRIDPQGREIGPGAIVGVSQLLSVPYAIYAQYADSTKRGHQIGDLFGGGIIFSVWKDAKGVEHGLIASLMDISEGAIWGEEITINARSPYDGATNTATIVEAYGSNNAAGLCDAYAVDSYTDWYLPAIWELNMLYNQAFLLSRILEEDDDSSTKGLYYADGEESAYWSSTQDSNERASEGEPRIVRGRYWLFNEGTSGNDSKTTPFRVRAIRRF